MTGLYRVLLRAFPRRFRAQYGDDMTAVFADRLAEARRRGSVAMVSFWIRTALDVAHHGLAERRARRRIEQEGSRMSWMTQDLRDAWRSLRARPISSSVALLTLAVGIGATTAVFSVIEALALRPVPVPHADRIYVVEEVNARLGFGGNVAMPNFEDWRARATTIEVAAASTAADVNFASGGTTDRLRGALATPGLFDLAGARVLAGRVFRDDEREPGREQVVVLSDSAWSRLFARDPSVVGRSATIDGQPHDIIGIVDTVPTHREVAIWRPLARTGSAVIRRNHAYRGLIRLRDGVSADAAQSELNLIYTQLEAAYPDTNRDWRSRITPLQDFLTEDFLSGMRLLAGVMTALMAIVCVNLASLLLARTMDRRRELAVRAALGASRGRLVRQVFVESVLLGVAGAAAGLLIAQLSMSAVLAIVVEDAQLWTLPGLNGRVLAFTTALGVAAALAFGLLPALATRRAIPQEALRHQTTPATSRSGRRLRLSLTFVQMTLSAALLVCAALLVGSLARVLRVDPGFDPSGTTTFRVTPPRGSYATADLLADYYDRLVQQVRAVPGVTAAGAASTLPLGRGMVVRGVIRPGDTPPPPDQMRLTLYQVATPGYLGAIGARLIAGRDFNDGDTAGAEPVTIINEAMAAALWPNEPALGREIFIYTDEKLPRRVVGIIQDMRQYGLDQRAELNYFVPMRQAPVRSMSVVLRTSGDVDGAAVRRAATNVDPTLPIYDVQSMAQALDLSLAPRESLTLLLVLLSAIGIALAAIGLYGNVASNVAERRREIGVRLALGAQPGSVLHLFLRQSLLLTIGAAVAGVLLSRWGVRLLEEQLFGVTASDAASPAIAMLTLVVAGMLASWIPARRALRIDPARTLRME